MVGLGNPGERFQRTRHNAGARAIEKLAENLGTGLKTPKPRLRPGKPLAQAAEARSDGTRLVLARPGSFMNESGGPVASLVRWFKIDPARLIILHDDIDLNLAVLRVKNGGGSGGNRGVESVARSLGTKDFYRIRIGVGRPPTGSAQEPADYVLEQMSRSAAEELREAEGRAAEAVEVLIHQGLDAAMGRFNNR